MSEMVERVARAIHAKEMSAFIWEHIPQPVLEHRLAQARAAISAMREPTKEMVGEAMIQPHPSVADAGGVIEQGQAAIRIDYQAMIDAALK